MPAHKTIYALATALGQAGVGVIRLSGPLCLQVYTQLTGLQKKPQARYAHYKVLKDPDTEIEIDDALILWFPAPHSYTGEDVLELHIHGSKAIIDLIFSILNRMEGLRLADPGEFTRRAVLNGKMDLTAAEGLMDLIEAETEMQRRQALRQSKGALYKLYQSWAQQLTKILANIETHIDFVDEDLPDGLILACHHSISSLHNEMLCHLDTGKRGERLRNGVNIAIIGPPNAGKSSLLNFLVKRNAAIVSNQAGTTRDVIRVHLNLNGYPVTISDTAGLRKDTNEIEAEGIKRAIDEAEHADLKLLVLENPMLNKDPFIKKWSDDKTLLVLNKSDLNSPKMGKEKALYVSIKTQEGLSKLLTILEERVAKEFKLYSHPFLTRERHRREVENATSALKRALECNEIELLAEDIRLALRFLGRLTGHVDVEDILDVVFRDFCIGK